MLRPRRAGLTRRGKGWSAVAVALPGTDEAAGLGTLPETHAQSVSQEIILAFHNFLVKGGDQWGRGVPL